jgi:hypothetical protein
MAVDLLLLAGFVQGLYVFLVEGALLAQSN